MQDSPSYKSTRAGLVFLISRSSGLTLLRLYNGGISTAQLKEAEVTIAQMQSTGLTISQIHAGGVSVSDLRSAMISVADLYHAGVTVAELSSGGVSIADLRSAGIADHLVFNGACNTPDSGDPEFTSVTDGPVITSVSLELDTDDNTYAVVLEGKAFNSIRWQLSGSGVDAGRVLLQSFDSVGDTKMLGDATFVYVRDEGSAIISTLSIPLVRCIPQTHGI